MKKEINQKGKNSILFKCNCGGHHYVEFDYFDDDNYMEYWVSVVNDGLGKGFFGRIADAWRYIFRRGSVLRWYEVGLTSRDLKRLKKHIDKYLEALKK